MTSEEVIGRLKAVSHPTQKDIDGMKRYGINTDNSLCITMPELDKISREIRKQSKENRHKIALEIWESGIREARILAARIDVPELVTSEQMEDWVLDFDSWDVCDNTIMKLFSYSPLGWEKAIPWSHRDEEYVKRAGFVTMAMLAMHDKKTPDEAFYPFFERMLEEATDDRNFVRKAVNWALRQIGKSRTKVLYRKALETAAVMEKIDNKTARWIARDAIRELTTSKYVLKRFDGK